MVISLKQNCISLFILCLCFAKVAFAQQPAIELVTQDEISAEIGLAPCNNEDRLEAVRKLFQTSGATDADISIQKFRDIQNLVVTKKGKSDETIVISAHYDKVKDGCGAIDNWTGIVIIANIYRTLRHLDTEKTLLFVAFDKEELGLFGSQAMVRAIPKDKRQDYCSNINLDSFGFTYPQVLDNVSTQKMADMAKALADEVKMPYGHASLQGAADADSSSFKSAGIPAVTLHGLNNDWQKYLHSSKDIVKNINPSSVMVAYQFLLRFVAKVDASNCAIFR